MKLSDLIGREKELNLLQNAAEELAYHCQYDQRMTKSKEETNYNIRSAFTKVCAYGMDLGLTPSKDATREVIQKIFEKMEETRND